MQRLLTSVATQMREGRSSLSSVLYIYEDETGTEDMRVRAEGSIPCHTWMVREIEKRDRNGDISAEVRRLRFVRVRHHVSSLHFSRQPLALPSPGPPPTSLKGFKQFKRRALPTD